MIKKILIGIGIILFIIQFIRPGKNISEDQTYDISTSYEIPNEVNHLLQTSCNDCHSNKTSYPWYANMQPMAWWIDDHIKDGKSDLNFSEFTRAKIAIQNHKFEEIIEEVDEHEMPLASYTYLGLHSEAKLSAKQRQLIIDWAEGQMELLKEKYPADSLIMPRRKNNPATEK